MRALMMPPLYAAEFELRCCYAAMLFSLIADDYFRFRAAAFAAPRHADTAATATLRRADMPLYIT